MRALSFNKLSLCALFSAVLSLALGSNARAETIEVQAVSATAPGQKNAQVPESLARYRGDLAMLAFGTFADSGSQTATLSAASPKASVQAGSFTLEMVRQSAATVNVTVKEGRKVVMTPIVFNFAKERTKQIQLPDGKKTLIVFLTLSKE